MDEIVEVPDDYIPIGGQMIGVAATSAGRSRRCSPG